MKTLVLAAAIMASPAIASAQEVAGPPPNVRMRIGPLFVNPTLALSNAGRDTNVFNDSTNPKEDFTVTITPATDLWLRLGPTWVQSNIREDIVWFQQYASERSANNTYSLKWMVPLNRLSLTPSWSYTNTRDRPGFEIDARAQRSETAYGGTIEYRLFTKTFVAAQAARNVTDFAEGGVFRGTDLRQALNRTSTTESVSLRHQLTPLTSLTASGSLTQDRFAFDPLRNSDARSVGGSIHFDPAALLKGTVSFGYEDFTPASPDVPGFQGSLLAADLSYVLLGVTKFGGSATRSIQYSYDINQPYYVQTGGTATISQQIFGPVDVVAHGGLALLEYRTRVGAIVPTASDVDHEKSYGFSVGYHLGRDTRVGVNADNSRRESVVQSRQYQGWTYGVSVTYASGAGS